MKKFPVLSILYYGFAVILGIILAFYFFMHGEQLKVIDTLKARASSGDSRGVVRLLSGYQNSEAVFNEKIETVGDVAVYEAVTTYTETKNDKSSTKLCRGYLGIITNPTSTWKRDVYTNGEGVSTNHFGVKFTGLNSDSETREYVYRIGYSNLEKYTGTEEALYRNRSASYEVSGFYYFMLSDVEFKEAGFTSVTGFEFMNNDESIVDNSTVTLNNAWTLDTKFLSLVSNYTNKYNALVDDGTINQDNVNSLTDTFDQEYQTHDKFTKSDYRDVIKNEGLFAVLKMVAYILIVLILGDFLVGRHYIINLFRRLFGKNKAPKIEEVDEYITPHELNTTFEASVPDNYKKEVTIKYQNEAGEQYVFNLKPQNGYKETKLLMSGIYSHPEIVAEGLQCLDTPSLLKVNGLTYKAKFVFERKAITVNESEK